MLTTTIIDQTEVPDHNIIQVRFGKIIVDDDGEEIVTYHRTCIEPGVDVDEQIAAVTAHLARPDMGGYPAPDTTDVDKLKSIVKIVHTPDVIKAHKKREAARQSGADPQPAPVANGLMEKRVCCETVIKRDGTVIVRRDQVIESNGVELARRNLDPVVIEPGANVDDRLADTGLETAHVERIKKIVELKHAPKG